MASVDDKLSEFKAQMAVTGATLVSDGWTDVQNRPIINFLAVTADGAMFIDGTDTSGEQKEACYIADEIKKTIKLLGIENVVQVVTDSAGNCVAARSALAVEFPTIVFSPCTAHCRLTARGHRKNDVGFRHHSESSQYCEVYYEPSEISRDLLQPCKCGVAETRRDKIC